MPVPGTFILYSHVRPALTAGDYVLHGAQEVAGGPVAPYDGHIRITAPRYTMPPDQVLSTFPPANAEGAFNSRLPQIVLRRRTLPWERSAGSTATVTTPWLALVVIAEGEGQLSGETPVGQCVTAGVTLTGPNDVATSVYLAVTRTVVDAVFPTQDDLPLLAHVREVDIDDTELILGDDDGWLAVVLANRLPQPGQRYLACLVNLEGQLDTLPVPKPPATWVANSFDSTAVIQDFRGVGSDLDADSYVMGNVAVAAQPTGAVAAQPPTARTAARASTRAAASSTVSQAWQSAPRTIEQVAVSATGEDAYRVVRDSMGAGFRLAVEAFATEPTYRFPVLAHWSFTCTGSGDFQSLMQNLDVGLLGTLPAPPLAPPPGAPPAPPPARPIPEVAETGHVGLAHLTRRGQPAVAWFRGPLSAQLTERQEPGPDGRLPIAHTSDQIRRIVPDGREDLTYAAAFEIGRLLSFAQPSVVAALLRWRAEQFGMARARQIIDTVTDGILGLGDLLAGHPPTSSIGPLVARQLLLIAGAAPATVFGPSRPLADPGRALDFVEAAEQDELDAVVARGLGLDLGALRESAGQLGVVNALSATAVPEQPVFAAEPLLGGADVAHLRDALTAATARLARDVRATGPARQRDTLDALLGIREEES